MKVTHADLRPSAATGAILGSSLATGSIQAVPNLLADKREIESVGKTDLMRGACWVGPLLNGKGTTSEPSFQPLTPPRPEGLPDMILMPHPVDRDAGCLRIVNGPT